MNKQIMEDILLNLSNKYTEDEIHLAYAKGIIVGTINTVRAMKNCDYTEAFEEVKDCLPNNLDMETMPKAWKKFIHEK